MIIGSLIEEVNAKNKRIGDLEEGLQRIQQMIVSANTNNAAIAAKAKPKASISLNLAAKPARK